MTVAAPPAAKKGIFYGWYLVAAAFVLQLLNGGIYFYGFSAFFNPLIEEFHWSRAALAGAFSFARLEQGIMAPIVGFLVDRFGPRRQMVAGLVVISIGFFLVSRVDSLVSFYIVFFLVSIGASFSFGSPISASVANWFSRRRTLALGISMCGAGLGGGAVVVLAWLISQYGWRTTSMIAAGLFFFVGIPLALMMRHKPEQYGYLPDGDTPEPSLPATDKPSSDTVVSSARANPDAMDYTPKQALATSTFWIFSIVFGLRTMITSGIAVHEIPALIDAGFSPEFAASALGLMTVLSIPARLGFGWLFDRYDKRYGIALCMSLQCVGLFIFANITEFWHVALFLAVFSPAYGGMVPLVPSTWAHYFGRRHYASIAGLGQLVQIVGNVAGPMFAGYVFDVSGSYKFAFLLFAVANLPGIVLVFLARRRAPKAAMTTT